LKTVVLHGDLAKNFGERFEFDIKSPVEAIRALSANYPDFKQYLIEHNTPGYRIIADDEEFGEEELHYPISREIHIVPVIEGAGGGLGKVVLGALLIYVSMGMGTAIAGATAAGSTTVSTYVGTMAVKTATTLASVAGKLGWALALGGASQILFAPPKVGTNDKEERKSTNFDGPENLTSQGIPVPLAYGQVLIGSVVVGSSLITSSQLLPNSLNGVSAVLAGADLTIRWNSGSLDSIVNRLKVYVNTDKFNPTGGTEYTVTVNPGATSVIVEDVDLPGTGGWVWVQSLSEQGLASGLQGPFNVYDTAPWGGDGIVSDPNSDENSG